MTTRIKSAVETIFGEAPDPDAARKVDMELLAAHERWKQRVFDAAVDFALRDDAFRKRLARKLRDLGETRPHHRGIAVHEAMNAASAVELFVAQYAGTRRAHLLKTPRLFDEIARLLGVSHSMAKRRYYRAVLLGFIPARRHSRNRAK